VVTQTSTKVSTDPIAPDISAALGGWKSTRDTAIRQAEAAQAAMPTMNDIRTRMGGQPVPPPTTPRPPPPGPAGVPPGVVRWLISCDETGMHGAQFYGFGSLWMMSGRKLVQIEASERWQRDFRWPAGDTIAGRVVTADGAPVPKEGVFVVPKHQNVRNGSGHGVWMYTDADGRFAFLHLSPAGEWILTLSAGAYREARVKVTTGSVDVVVTAVAK